MNIMSAVLNAMGRPGRGMSSSDLEKRSEMTIITVFPCELGRPNDKVFGYMRPGTLTCGKWHEFTYGSMRGTLNCAHTEHEESSPHVD